MQYALSGKPELKPFEAEKTAEQIYQDEDYQPVYFVTESFNEAKEQLRRYSKTIQKPYQIRYDPHTQSIRIVDDLKIIQEIHKSIEINTETMLKVLDRFLEFKF